MEATTQRGSTEWVILPGVWLCFDLDDDEDLAARCFTAKYGRTPERILEGGAYYGSDRHRTAYKGQAMGDAFHFQATLNRFGFRVWSREEVMELLCGVNTAIMDFPDELPETPESRAYCGGHQHTMRAVAHSFGLEYSNRNR